MTPSSQLCLTGWGSCMLLPMSRSSLKRLVWSRGPSARLRRARLARKGATLLAIVGLVAASTGCAAVAPYERGKLAHPTMSAGSLDTMGEDHLHAISEGATGGSGGTGSGCGCN